MTQLGLSELARSTEWRMTEKARGEEDAQEK